MEIWKKIKESDIYEVSNYGNVRSYVLGYSKLLKPGKMSKKYYGVVLSLNGVRKHKYLHRLVAEVFIDNPQNLPEVNHKDLNKANCRVDNLEWCTHKQNIHHARKIKSW